MSVVDQFDIDDCIEEQPLLEYVCNMVYTHLPDADFDAEGNGMLMCSLNGLYTFVQNYNQGTIKTNFTYNDYMNGDEEDKNIQLILKAFNIDSKKFWYFLLFAFDFAYTNCVGGLVAKESPAGQMKKFVKAIDDNSTGKINGNDIEFKQKATITLKIGKKSIVIDNNTAIYLMASLCDEELNGLKTGSVLNSAKLEESNSKDAPNYARICLFTKIMIDFFKQYVVDKPVKNGDKIASLNKFTFISKLIYLTGIYNNEDWLYGDEHLKSCYREFKTKTQDFRFNKYSAMWH